MCTRLKVPFSTNLLCFLSQQGKPIHQLTEIYRSVDQGLPPLSPTLVQANWSDPRSAGARLGAPEGLYLQVLISECPEQNNTDFVTGK